MVTAEEDDEMLVLERFDGDEIVIGRGPRQIRVVIVGAPQGVGIRVGIDAPKDIEVDRLEVRERKDREGRRACSDSSR